MFIALAHAFRCIIHFELIFVLILMVLLCSLRREFPAVPTSIFFKATDHTLKDLIPDFNYTPFIYVYPYTVIIVLITIAL